MSYQEINLVVFGNWFINRVKSGDEEVKIIDFDFKRMVYLFVL